MLREFEIQSWPDFERTGVDGISPECWEAVGWEQQSGEGVGTEK